MLKMKPLSQIRIFSVEDSFVYSYVLEQTLIEHGNFKITTFTSGEECIDALSRSIPDIIILDYNLEKGMNGLEVLRQIRKRTRIPVIVLSSQPDVQVAADFLKEGATDYIQKKSNDQAMEKLQNAILQALNK